MNLLSDWNMSLTSARSLGGSWFWEVYIFEILISINYLPVANEGGEKVKKCSFLYSL